VWVNPRSAITYESTVWCLPFTAAIFFFSSRRRHTRWPRDWSSDVCSSDLSSFLKRALVANAVHGVTAGFKKELDIVGVGYRAELKGKSVAFALGKSHPIDFPIPEGIQEIGRASCREECRSRW